MSRLNAERRKKVRSALFLQCNGHCYYCGRKFEDINKMTLDHIIATANGGTNEISNLALTCLRCNHIKDNDDSLIKLRKFLWKKQYNRVIHGHGFKTGVSETVLNWRDFKFWFECNNV